MIVDLSHVFEDGMPGTRFKAESGETVELTARIRPYMTHAQSLRHYDGKASFEISDVGFQSSVGTKMDAPRHRYEGADDVASIELDRLVLDGVVIDARHAEAGQQLGWTDLEFPEHLAGRAVLVSFGQRFRFFSIPLKARDAAAFPVRAFAEVRG